MGPWLDSLLILGADALAVWLIACFSLAVRALYRRRGK